MKSFSRRNFINMLISGSAYTSSKEIGYPSSFLKSFYEKTNEVDLIAESYVKLALQISKYDSNYIDTYYGPDEWKQDIKVSLPQVTISAEKLLDQLTRVNKSGLTQLELQRLQFLKTHISAAKSKVDILSGKKMSFDEEFLAIYSEKADRIYEPQFREIIDKVEKLIPGNEGIFERIQKIKSDLIVPKDRLTTVFSATIDETRRKTSEYINLPPDEKVRVEYVSDVPFYASCTYMGNNTSLYEINTSIQIDLFWAICNVCHETYPGHHTFYNLIDQNFKKHNKWIEYSIIPICSPMELMLEGTAVYNLDLIFPMNERIDFGIKLADLAGLDSSRIELYFKVCQHLYKLKFMAYGEVAQEYLDGEINREEALKKYMKYALVNEQEAALMVKRFESDERSYLKTYFKGWQLIENYIKLNSDGDGTIEKQWVLYNELLTKIPTSTIWKQIK